MSIRADQLHGLYVSWQEAIAESGLDVCVQDALLLIASAQIDLYLSPTLKQAQFLNELHRWFDEDFCGNGHADARTVHDYLLTSYQENLLYNISPVTETPFV